MRDEISAAGRCDHLLQQALQPLLAEFIALRIMRFGHAVREHDENVAGSQRDRRLLVTPCLGRGPARCRPAGSSSISDNRILGVVRDRALTARARYGGLCPALT